MPITVGDQVGRIVGAPAGSTVMHQNVAIAEAVVLSCFLPVDPRRNRVVYERDNFPSVRYLYQAQPDLEVVVCEDDEAIVDAIDERTLLVPISHVLFKTGEIQDVEPIIRRAHEVGAHVILDCYQSAGIVPFDVTALGVDFAVGGSVKWLCGGPGQRLALRPPRPRGAARRRPTRAGRRTSGRSRFEEEMDYAHRRDAVPHRHAERARALRGDRGLRPDRGDRRRAHPRELAAPDAAADRPRRRRRLRRSQPARAARRGGTVTVHVPEFPAVYRELMERQILCDFRPDAGIRLGPHYFNTDDELRHAIAQIGEIVETGAFERHIGTVARH